LWRQEFFAGNLLVAYWRSFSQKIPVKNLRKSAISGELFADVDNDEKVSSPQQNGFGEGP
jgi:hypothetical protein